MTKLHLTMKETPKPDGGYVFDFQLQRLESDDATEREKLIMRGLSDHIERTIREADEEKSKTGFDVGWVLVGLALGAAIYALMENGLL
jgi:hypothetical protein